MILDSNLDLPVSLDPTRIVRERQVDARVRHEVPVPKYTQYLGEIKPPTLRQPDKPVPTTCLPWTALAQCIFILMVLKSFNIRSRNAMSR